MSDLLPTLERLRKAYDNPEYQEGLNVDLRKALRLYASAARLEFVQDNAGNIHIWRHGRDPDLANIAVAFQLDENRSKSACESAFRVFYQLQRENLLCGVTLLGWTSVGNAYIGRNIWELAGAKTELRPWIPALEQFSAFQDVSEFPLSAIFEMVEDQSEQLQVEGTHVLTEQIRQILSSHVSTRTCSRKLLRAPEVLLTGPKAEQIGLEAIKAYSAYVGALFDNFD